MMKKQKEVDKIDFEGLVQEYRVHNVNIFVQYLKEIFRDLAERSDDMSQGLTSITFGKYYELPGIISQRLFAVLDADNNGYLDIIEFIEGMVCLYSESYEKLARFIFNFYDFDKDQLISKEDCRTVMSYVPLNTKSKINSLKLKFEKGTFKDRVESQEELFLMLEKAFEGKETMDFTTFLEVVENVSSDIFLFILIFLYESRPFTKTTLKNYELAKSKVTNSLKLSKSPILTSTNKLIASPNIKNSKFIPTIAISKSPIIMKKTMSISNTKTKNDLLLKLAGVKSNKNGTYGNNNSGNNSSSTTGDMRSHLLKYTQQGNKSNSSNLNQNSNKDSDSVNNNNSSNSLLSNKKPFEKQNSFTKSIPVQRKNRNNLRYIDKMDNTQYFSINNNKDKDMLDFPITPAVKYKTERVKNSSNDTISDLLSISNLSQCTIEDEERDCEEVQFEGHLYKITNSRKLKRLWFKLLHKDLYYYKSQEETTHTGIHNISGCYINEENSVLCDSLPLYCFSVVYPKKSRFYYVDNEKEFHSWIVNLRKATGYKNLTDIYDIGDKLGNGKFGLVRLGVHKETNRQVAVKIMSKIKMNDQDLEMVRTEIEILKICQHPNIIRLYDIFENVNYFYIIMECCTGGDLFSYIQRRGFRLPEQRAAQIIHKLCCAVYYLHSYGIAHRDLKPENILMTDNTDTADIKLVDFGLSKIIGPNEFCNEPYGTISYVSPEVLLERPYTKAVDMWSIGVIAYLLLSGFLPFDHESSEKEIARQTIYDPVKFPNQIWNKNTSEGRNFVENLLHKDASYRMTITQALEHTWFQKFNMNHQRLKTSDYTANTFKLYTTTDENKQY